MMGCVETKTASSNDIHRSDLHSSIRLLIRRFRVRIPGGPTLFVLFRVMLDVPAAHDVDTVPADP